MEKERLEGEELKSILYPRKRLAADSNSKTEKVLAV